ncbi:uncharacterized protein LOC131025822 [Salvia miltiorrhiza]|uniref:uncharacterized protein LOC131025822 n=1 Tax=Salvia miltiorrhiza TaxID=226208 RepID=UPI0025AD869E|nr:uncharacterized protein LOC131025822 [Salvia miltiorrhiza]
MAAYHVRAKELMSKFQDCFIEQIPREQNNKAGLIARMASVVKHSWMNSVTLLFEPSPEGKQGYGSPRVLISDNGSQFIGKQIGEFCHRMDILQGFVYVAHPHANGQVELTNRTICEGLKKRLEKSKERWAEEFDGVLWAHRTSPKMATGEAPFTLVYGSNNVILAEVRLASHRILHYDPIQNDEL